MVGTAVLVAVVVLGSTAHAVRREHGADDRRRTAAAKAVLLSVVPSGERQQFIALPGGQRRDYDIELRNDGSDPVVLTRASWYDGQGIDLDARLPAGGTLFVPLPFPPCPSRRVTQAPPGITVGFRVQGRSGTREVFLDEPQDALDQLNGVCGLYRAAESFSGGVFPVRLSRGEVVLDIEAAFNGSRDTIVKEVRAGDGIALTSTGGLPVTLKPDPPSPVARDLPVLTRVTLRLTDCAAVVKALREDVDDALSPTLPPNYQEVQLLVQRPGDDPERVNLNIGPTAANALSRPCVPQVAPLPEESYETVPLVEPGVISPR